MAKKFSTTQLSLIIAATVVILVPYSRADIGECDNRGTAVFNCSGVELTTIPSYRHVPSYYQTIDLSNNYISNISKLDFPANNNITTLLLTNNQISKIEAKAFGQMTKLITLDLSGNVLEGRNMDEYQFNDLLKLEQLIMERNPLGFIRKGTFHFMELFSLKRLDLSHGDISQLEAGAIDVPSLEYLDLSWNKLELFHKESFTMLVSLKTLDLSHNQFTILDQVPNMPKLQVWILDNNKINNVSMREEIRHLAYSLEDLYIRNNDLTTFNEDSFPWEQESLKGIHLDNNPIHCNCQMKWVVRDKDLKGRNFTIPCKTPSKHRGRNLLSIPSEELRCGIPFYKILLLIGLSLVVILCFLVVLFCIVKRKKARKSLLHCIVKRKKVKKSPQTQMKTVNGADYTAVYTKEADEVSVAVSDKTNLLNDITEVDV